MIELFQLILAEATAKIATPYFQLPIAGEVEPIYRERVYSYELYHQLRALMDEDERFAQYALSGEIDKQGHPIIRRCAPDLVFHSPGTMDSNLVVIEVKAVNAALDGILKDFANLGYFVSRDVNYQLGIELVYGDDESFARFEKAFPSGDTNQKLQLFWHRCPGESAKRVR